MKKTLMAVASVAMAVALTGCGGSPSDVAEDFVNAIIQKDPGAAVGFFDTVTGTSKDPSSIRLRTDKEIKKLKDELESLGKAIDDGKLEAHALVEVVRTPGDGTETLRINRTKYTGETAVVTVQYVKGKEKKSKGVRVYLVNAGGSWKVTDYDTVSDLDDSNK